MYIPKRHNTIVDGSLCYTYSKFYESNIYNLLIYHKPYLQKKKLPKPIKNNSNIKI